MSEIERLEGSIERVDLGFVERERTPELVIEVGIQLHLMGYSFWNTKRYLEGLGIERGRITIHERMKKADLQPTSDTAPRQVALDKSVICVNDERHWLCTVFGCTPNGFLHIRLFQTWNTQLTVLLLWNLRDHQ